MEKKVFQQIWDQLRFKKVQYPYYLDQIMIQNLRGVSNLSINFHYPVSVVSGANGSGKSTVLFSCACAYQPISGNSKLFTPSSLFPNLTVKQKENLQDVQQPTLFEFYYIIENRKQAMRWHRGKSWNKSFMGQKKAHQPKRDIYFRTLANLATPSEVRSILQMSQKENLEISELTVDLIAFAHRVLPYQYNSVRLVKKENKELMFVIRNDNEKNSYSEFHMSAGERAILRISKDISHLKDTLVLIDEIEAGLHPYTQKTLMLELQRIALRNNLQIIVTTHSPVIIESVPLEARIFLERIEGNVILKPAYKDIIQRSLYGQTIEKLNLLCEDEIGEAFLLGIFDYINPKLNIIHDDIQIGRDTGKDEFPNHIHTLGKFHKLQDFIFVLDGDAKDILPKIKIAGNQYGVDIKPLFLLGEDIPESWAWRLISSNTLGYSKVLGLSEPDLIKCVEQSNQLFDNATDKQTNKNKAKFYHLCELLKRSSKEVMRIISRQEATKESGEVKVFMDELEILIRNWLVRK